MAILTFFHSWIFQFSVLILASILLTSSFFTMSVSLMLLISNAFAFNVCLRHFTWYILVIGEGGRERERERGRLGKCEGEREWSSICLRICNFSVLQTSHTLFLLMYFCTPNKRPPQIRDTFSLEKYVPVPISGPALINGPPTIFPAVLISVTKNKRNFGW